MFMDPLIQEFTTHLYNFYGDFREKDQPPMVDLEKEFHCYSFLDHHPEEQAKIDELFKKTVIDSNNQSISLSELLEASELGEEDLSSFYEMGFNQINSHPETGVSLEHPSFKGWLIKKNYGFLRQGDLSKRIVKSVSASDFPKWMLPDDLKSVPEDKPISIKVPNDIIHPLRVAMLKRGRQWIRRLQLTCVKAAKEYLFLLPNADPSQPFYKRVVVISKKENILSESENLHRFAKIVHDDPLKLQEISRQIVLLVKNWKITDAHLHNLRFLDDGTDTLMCIDGEPIGALADASQPEMVKAIQAFDQSFYSLLGLKKLQNSLPMQMEEEGIAEEDSFKIQKIFNANIAKMEEEINRERTYRLIEEIARRSSFFIDLILNLFAAFRSFYQRYFAALVLS